VLEQEVPIAIRGRVLAVVDARELAVGAQPRRHGRGDSGTRCGIASLHRDQDQPRCRSRAQLVDQQALRGRRPRRQKRRQVGDVARVRRDRRSEEGEREPASDAAQLAGGHEIG
jgi:hypothetical protein